MATIGAYYVKTAIRGFQERGGDIPALLAAANVAPEILHSANGRVHIEQWNQLVIHICRELDDEFMGFTSDACHWGSLALMAELVRHSDNLRGLLALATRFYNTTTRGMSMHLREDGPTATFSIELTDPSCDPDNFCLEFWLVIMHRFCSWYIGKQIKLQQVELTYTPVDYFDEFQLLFRSDNKFDSSQNALHFHSSYLQQPLIQARSQLRDFLRQIPLNFLTMPSDEDSFCARVRLLLNHHYQQQGYFIDVEEALKHLHVSEQTLRRKLQAEGSSFQKLKNDMRRDIAIEKLMQKMSITDVAMLLGFTETRSFTRAFKQWTGVSPSSYRKQR